MKIYHVIKIEEVETSKVLREYYTETGERKTIYETEQKEIDLGCFTSNMLIENFINKLSKSSTIYEEYIFLKTLKNNLQEIINNRITNTLYFKEKILELNKLSSKGFDTIQHETVLNILTWLKENDYIYYEYDLKLSKEEIGETDQ